MRTVDSLPHAVREHEHVWIPMPDGCRLSARLWLPVGAEQNPVPAVLESGPYRKRDTTRERDERMHRWFAGYGYACVRVDVRGTGESEGVLQDEYSEQEQRDGADVVAWIAAQPWCDGAVGMIGKSWGGIAALQVAALRPPALRAVIAVCATDDRWATDAHWMGGCLLVENLTWGAMLMTLAAQPPDPALSGDAPEPPGTTHAGEPRWRARWLERLHSVSLYPAEWMRHPTRDAFWRRGSVADDLARIECPVYAIGGWSDAYTDSVPRLLAGLRGARKGLVGPWAHLYPHEATPRPTIGFLQEAKRWWDRHLRGIANGIDAEPMYRVWMQQHPRRPVRAPAPHAPGRWVAEAKWPSARIASRRIELKAPDYLTRTPTGSHVSPQTVGGAAPPWCAFGFEPDIFPEQTPDDVVSLGWDSEILAERIEILGAPVVELDIMVNQPRAFVAVRLCDVAPGKDSTRVSYGLLDLAQRRGPEHRDPVVPGERMRLRVPLRHAAHSFASGHRLRVMVSSTYWPIAWPTPDPVRLHVFACTLDLPVRPPDSHDEILPRFEPPESAVTDAVEEVTPFVVFTRVGPDPDRDGVVHTTNIDLAADASPARARFTAIDLEHGHGIEETLRITRDDPLAAEAAIRHRTVHRRGDWEARVEVQLHVGADRDAFTLDAELRAHEGPRLLLERRWRERVPRP